MSTHTYTINSDSSTAASPHSSPWFATGTPNGRDYIAVQANTVGFGTLVIEGCVDITGTPTIIPVVLATYTGNNASRQGWGGLLPRFPFMRCTYTPQTAGQNFEIEVWTGESVIQVP